MMSDVFVMVGAVLMIVVLILYVYYWNDKMILALSPIMLFGYILTHVGLIIQGMGEMQWALMTAIVGMNFTLLIRFSIWRVKDDK